MNVRQAKPTNKNENYLMARKMPGQHADRLRQAHGQFSSECYKLLRKSLYTESAPEILASTPKKIVKIREKCGSVFFYYR